MKNLSLIAAFLLLGMAANAQITAHFISKSRVCSGVQFELLSDGAGANAYRWFIDGNLYATTQDTVAEFSTTCSDYHVISLVALNTGDGTTDTFSKTVSVLATSCIGQFGVDYEGCYADTFVFYSHSDAVSNLWNFSESQQIIAGCDTCHYVKFRLTSDGLDLYNVVTYEGGCQDYVAYNHTFCPSGWLSVEEVAGGSGITIAPNPLSDKALLTFPNTAGKPHTFQLYNSEGRIVRQIEHITTGQLELSRDGLSSGTYFYLLTGATTAPVKGKIFIR